MRATRAAEELCVTQGAVSHQVKALEAELGLKLFHREPQRLVITEAGRDYLVVVRDALDRIAVGTEPRRVCRRLQLWRDWSYDKADLSEIFTGSARACRADGA